MPNDTLSGALPIVAIIPLYNGAKFIRRSLDSVFAQTLAPAEIIVVDDGSTDDGEGAKIAAAVADGRSNFRILHKTNGGQSSARNLGVAQSTSPLIAFLDQDDAWYPDHLEKLSRPFRRSKPRLGWVYSNLDQVDCNWNMICHRFLSTLPTMHPKRDILTCLSQDMFVLPSASIISRAAFNAVGGFDERLCGYEDDDLFLRLFRAGYDNIFLPEALSAWCIRPDSTSFTIRMAASRRVYLAKLLEDFPDDQVMHRFWRRDAIAPRFRNNFLGEYMRALHFGRPEAAKDSLTAIRGLLCHMRLRHRLVFTAILPFMGNYTLARLAYRVRLHMIVRRMLAT